MSVYRWRGNMDKRKMMMMMEVLRKRGRTRWGRGTWTRRWIEVIMGILILKADGSIRNSP